MKTPASKPIVLGIFGLAIAAMLPSCVVNGPGYGPPAAGTRVGYHVRTLPYGYHTEVIGGTVYYVHGGNYYRPYGRGQYIVAHPPHRVYTAGPHSGVVVTRLPYGHRVIVHRGVRYYQVRDVYYRQTAGGYVVVARPF